MYSKSGGLISVSYDLQQLFMKKERESTRATEKARARASTYSKAGGLISVGYDLQQLLISQIYLIQNLAQRERKSERARKREKERERKREIYLR